MPRPRVRSRRCSRTSSLERAPDGDEAAAVALRQVALRGQPVARAPLTLVEGGLQVQVDLVVQRDRAELESETCHRAGRTSGDGCRLSGALAAIDARATAGLEAGAIADNVISNLSSPGG